MIQNNISTDASPNFSRVAFESNGALLRENSASRASTQSVAGRAKAMTREAQNMIREAYTVLERTVNLVEESRAAARNCKQACQKTKEMEQELELRRTTSRS